MKTPSNRTPVRTLAALALACAAAVACAREPKPAPPPAVNSPAGNQLKAAGKAAPLTVYPTSLAGSPMPRVGEVVAMMLERAGMTSVETSETAFVPPEGADTDQTASAFADFIKASPPATDYALFTDFMGTRQTGVNEVRAVIVSRQGEIVWQDRQAKGDADFDRLKPSEPMECCLLVAARLRPVLGLGDPTKDNAPQGKVAQRWAKATGIASDAERAAIEERGRMFKKAAATSTLVVYPSHAGDASSVESAKAIAARINEEGLAKAVPADAAPEFEIARGMNQQKSLWSLARGFSKQVRTHAPDADFALLGDYIMGNGGVAGVNFVVCDKMGEIIVVDFQNSHWPDFNAVKPKTREDCDRLLVRRLAEYCR